MFKNILVKRDTDRNQKQSVGYFFHGTRVAYVQECYSVTSTKDGTVSEVFQVVWGSEGPMFMTAETVAAMEKYVEDYLTDAFSSLPEPDALDRVAS